jgi:sarcosine oxidase delta subunit
MFYSILYSTDKWNKSLFARITNKTKETEIQTHSKHTKGCRRRLEEIITH